MAFFYHFASYAGRWSSTGLILRKLMSIALGLCYGNLSRECSLFRTWQPYRRHLLLSTKVLGPLFPMIVYLSLVRLWPVAGMQIQMWGRRSPKLLECWRLQKPKSWQLFGKLASGVASRGRWQPSNLVERKCKLEKERKTSHKNRERGCRWMKIKEGRKKKKIVFK